MAKTQPDVKAQAEAAKEYEIQTAHAAAEAAEEAADARVLAEYYDEMVKLQEGTLDVPFQCDPDSEAAPEPAVKTFEPPATETTEEAEPVNLRPISRIAQILMLTTEKSLLSELKRFEDSINEEAEDLQDLLRKDVHTSDVAAFQNHMSAVECWRERVSRWSALAKAFKEHCKSDHFIVKRQPGMKITELDREAYQKRLLAGFVGLDIYLEELIKCIDSRVNMVKVLVRNDDAGQYHPGAQRVA